MFPKIILVCHLLLLLFSCMAQQEKSEPQEQHKEYKQIPLDELLPYAQLLDSVEKQRSGFETEYLAAKTEHQDSILTKAEKYLMETITTDFFNHWYGTEWDFNGTTKTPRQGKIACGYFITTVLTDAGFNIPRVYWAQQASEYYIGKMTSDIKRFSNQPAEKVKAYLLGRPDGLYIAGLDSHVGFVYKNGNEVTFTHASYYDPEIGVQTEQLDGDNPFAVSGYRVIGRILDREMVRKWVLGESWEK